MHLKNISKEYKICSSLFSKTIGLMFSFKPRTLIFTFNKEKYVPLHMFFVFFPIDVIFLDKNKKVVEIKKNFKPFTFYNPQNKAKYVIEINDSKGVKLGNKIEF